MGSDMKLSKKDEVLIRRIEHNIAEAEKRIIREIESIGE